MTFNDIKEKVAENPIAAAGATALVITAIAKLVDARSAAQGRRAYAKMVKNSTKKK